MIPYKNAIPGLVLAAMFAWPMAKGAAAETVVPGDKLGASSVDKSSSDTWKDLPRQFDNGSSLEYDMADWNLILRESVLYTGRSERRPAKRPSNRLTGNLLQFESTSPFKLEGNKVLFHLLGRRHKQFIRETVDRLAKLPRYVPLETLSQNAQLAYWLNLRNAIVLEKIIDVYPVRRLVKYTAPGASFPAEPVVDVLGISLSLQDIEKHITQTFKNELVFYGFYYGSLSSPNLRTRAFTAETVWADLEDNAVDYVNSLRGVQMKGNDTVARVSSLYGEYPELFDTGSPGFIRHLQQYAGGDLASKLAIATQSDVSIADWSIGDLVNGNIGPTLSNLYRDAKRKGGSVDLAVFIDQDMPAQAKQALSRIDNKNRRRYKKNKVNVKIEKVSESDQKKDGTQRNDASTEKEKGGK